MTKIAKSLKLDLANMKLKPDMVIWKTKEVRFGTNIKFRIVQDANVPANEIWLVNELGIVKLVEIETP